MPSNLALNVKLLMIPSLPPEGHSGTQESLAINTTLKLQRC